MRLSLKVWIVLLLAGLYLLYLAYFIVRTLGLERTHIDWTADLPSALQLFGMPGAMAMGFNDTHVLMTDGNAICSVSYADGKVQQVHPQGTGSNRRFFINDGRILGYSAENKVTPTTTTTETTLFELALDGTATEIYRTDDPAVAALNVPDTLWSVHGNYAMTFSIPSGMLRAVSADGTHLWDYSLPQASSMSMFMGCSVDEGINGTYIITSPMSSEIICLAADGQELWKQTATSSYSYSPMRGPVAADGTVYKVDQAASALTAYNADGGVKWNTKLDGAIQYNSMGYANFMYLESLPVVGADGTIYCWGNMGHLLAVSPAGELLWHSEVGRGMMNTPVAGTNGRVYLIAPGEGLVALGPNGRRLWVNTMMGKSFAYQGVIQIGRDGRLYILENNKLYCFAP